MKHQATIPKKKYSEIAIQDLEEKETVKNKEFIGRRTGKNLGDHIANGNDFLLKNDFTNILEKQQIDMYDLYSSDSSSSSSNEEESSSSESEAEESERENSSNKNMDTVYTKNESTNNFKKRIEPTVMGKNSISNVVVNLNENKTVSNNLEQKYKSLGNRIMKDSPFEDLLDEDLVNDKVGSVGESESESESAKEDEATSPEFNKNSNIINNVNVNNSKTYLNNKSTNINNKFVPQKINANYISKSITAKNNFKSNKKDMGSEKGKVKVEDEDELNLSNTSEAKVK